MKKLNYSRRKLADGFEDGILKQNFEIQVNGNKIEFSLEEFYDNSFNRLEDITDSEKKQMANTENFIISPVTGDYKSYENLTILYMKKNNLLILFSYGEFQPARYQLYLEAIYSR